MRSLSVLAGLLVGAAMAWPACASATPVSGPHETVDSQFTTTQPNAPTGFHYTGTYHAAGDPSADPPYMQKMVTYPSGVRFDTGAPPQCKASDLELATRGTAACPAGSVLGGGTSTTSFFGNKSTLQVDFINNANQQIILGHSPFLATVARGTIFPDGSVEFASPTCYPSLNPPGCPADDALQLGSDISVKPYTRTVNGVVRSYETTPAGCPASGHWSIPIRFWWKDGTTDTVTAEPPCAAPQP
jgi:hypothetical protein